MRHAIVRSPLFRTRCGQAEEPMPNVHHALFTLSLACVASMLAALVPAQRARPQGPCDLYAASGTPCVTAHSTVRSLSSRYTGPLYQVKRDDGQLLDIGAVDGG